MSDSDNLDLWARYTKGVKRIKNIEAKPTSQKPTSYTSVIPAKAGIHFDALMKKMDACFRRHDAMNLKRSQDTKLPNPNLFDWRTERKIKKGEVEIDGRIDLHGMTQKEAHTALISFIEKKAHTGAKRLLVITGKGRSGESVLRKNLPRWCSAAPVSKYILTLRPAAIKHGGEGAFYVMLRKSK